MGRSTDTARAGILTRGVLAALGLVLLTGLMAAALLAYLRQGDLDEGRRLTQAFVSVVDAQTARSLQELDQRLESIARRLGPLERPDAAAPELLATQLRRMPFVAALFVLDAQGRQRYTTAAEPPTTGHDAEDYFRSYLTRPGAGFLLGTPRQDGATAQWVLPASRPIQDGSGQFSGVVVALVQAGYFDAAWRALALESGSAVSLMRTDGTMLLRSPLDDAVLGRNYAQSALFTQYLPLGASGDLHLASPVDGAVRMAAYRTLARHPELLVVVGRTTDAVLARWRQMAMLGAAAWLLGSITLIGAAVWLGRLSARRTEAERHTLALAQRLSMASDAAGLVLWDWDPRQDHWQVTPTHHTMLGYPARDEPVQRSEWTELLHPDDLPLVLAAQDRLLLRGHSDYHYEARMRHADGSYRWTQTIGRVLERDAAGRPTRVIGVRIDVTERKRAEIERQQILARISDGFVALDREWRFVYANQRAGELLGRDPRQLIGKSIWDELPPLPGESFQALCLQAMADQKPARIEAYYPDLGLWIEDHIYPSPNGMSIHFRDISQRKADELALRQAKEYAESLIAHANVMIVGLDAHGDITLFSRTAQELTGYALADLAGRNWFDVLCPRERYPQVWEEFERLTGAGAARQFENPILTRGGQELTIAWQNTVLRDGETVTGTLSVGIDVTARRRAERELGESREQFETLARQSLQGILLLRKGQVVYLNPALSTIMGRSAAEISRMSLVQLTQWVHPDDRSGAVERQQRALQGEPDMVPSELRMLHGDGQWRWVQSATRAITLRGEPAILAMVLDIHDRKLAEMALRASEERFRGTFESSAIGISLADRDGRWIMVNPALCRIVGYPEQELLQLDYSRISHPDDMAQDRMLTAELYAGARTSFHMEKRYLHRDGHPVWIALTVALVHDAQGHAVHTVAHVEDISGRKQLEQELRASEELMRQMAESVSQMFWLLDMRRNRYLYTSPAVESVLGCSAAELQEDPRCWRRSIHPLDLARVETVLDQARNTGRYDLQLRLLQRDGSVRWIHARAYPVPGPERTPYRCAGVVEDITARRTHEIREAQERDILQYLASDRPMQDVLEKFVLGYEAMLPDMRGAILLADADGTRMRHGAAPHLPADYCAAMDGQAIDPATGTCGVAPCAGATVIAADIARDPRWADHRALALAHGLRACWSVPMRGGRGQMLGTFAFYFDRVRQPTPDEQMLLERGAQLASQTIERQLAVQELQHSEERYRALVESSPMGIIVYQQGHIVYANPVGAAMLGAESGAQLTDRPLMGLVHSDDRVPLLETIDNAVRRGVPSDLAERRFVRLDGMAVDAEVKASAIMRAGAPAVQLVLRDISARKKAEAELLDSRQQLRVLSAKVLAAQETERRRIAHELHDELGQALTAIKINLQAEEQLRQREDSLPMAENIRIVDQVLQQVRGLALALRPSMLDDLGLVPALRWLVEQTASRNAMQVRLQAPDPFERLAPDLETAAFRIVQEALTNVVRHARARDVLVSIDLPEPGTVRVRIRDDGAGFDVAAMRRRAAKGNSIGVLGMQERAMLVGAELAIESAPGKGCTVTLRCPLDRGSAAG